MAPIITMDYFDTENRNYHIYKIQDSAVAENPHYHDYFQVCFVSRGSIIHGQEGEKVTLGHGDAFIIPPGFSHSVNFVDKNSEIYSLSFAESMFHTGFSQSNAYKFLSMLREHLDPLMSDPVKLRVLLDATQQKNMQALLDCLIREQKARYPAEITSATSLIAAIVNTLSQNYYQQPQNREEYKEMAAYNNALSSCVEYIDGHFNENITLSVLVKQFGMSRSSFCAQFPQFTGLSLKQYIINRRIREAEMLIRDNPDMPLGEVAERIGYDETSTFYRNFVRITGVSPSKYKELHSR